MAEGNKKNLLDTKPRACFFWQAGFYTGFTCLTGGVFLSGLAYLMGAGDILVSYISVIANICGVFILFLASVLERFKNRKKLAVVLTVFSKIMTLLIAAIPLLVPKPMQLVLFVLLTVIAFTLQAQTIVVVNQWMIGFVDENRSGQYISLRQTLTMAVTIICSVTGGWWLDQMEGRYIGFAIIFLVAALLGGIEILLLVNTPDSGIQCIPARKQKFMQLLKIPLRDRSFMGFVLYIFAFYLLLNIADSFTTAYMLKYLELPYQTITVLSMLISLPQVALLAVWGKISDRRGHAFVLRTSVGLFAGEMLFLFLASPDSWQICIPTAFLIASVANGGFVVSVFNRRYELMPGENRIIYDNFYTAMIGFGFILGPMTGGMIKGRLEGIPAIEERLVFGGIRLLYIVAAAGILILQLVYSGMQRRKEKGGLKK